MIGCPLIIETRTAPLALEASSWWLSAPGDFEPPARLVAVPPAPQHPATVVLSLRSDDALAAASDRFHGILTEMVALAAERPTLAELDLASRFPVARYVLLADRAVPVDLTPRLLTFGTCGVLGLPSGEAPVRGLIVRARDNRFETPGLSGRRTYLEGFSHAAWAERAPPGWDPLPGRAGSILAHHPT